MMYFFKDEPKIAGLNIIAGMFIVVYIVSNRMPELFPFAKELMDLTYGFSISLISTTIFYLFQIYFPQRRIRIVAKKELQRVIWRIIGLYQNIFMSCISKSEVESRSIHVQGSEGILTPAVALEISANFDIQGLASCVNPNRKRSEYLSEQGPEHKEALTIIVQKYNTHLSLEMLEQIHDLQREPLWEYMRIIAWHDQEMKHIPINVLETFFERIKIINQKLNLDINPSIGSSLNVNSGLIGSSRLS